MLPVSRVEVVLARPADAGSAQLNVWLHAEVLVIFRFYAFARRPLAGEAPIAHRRW